MTLMITAAMTGTPTVDAGGSTADADPAAGATFASVLATVQPSGRQAAGPGPDGADHGQQPADPSNPDATDPATTAAGVLQALAALLPAAGAAAPAVTAPGTPTPAGAEALAAAGGWAVTASADSLSSPVAVSGAATPPAAGADTAPSSGTAPTAGAALTADAPQNPAADAAGPKAVPDPTMLPGGPLPAGVAPTVQPASTDAKPVPGKGIASTAIGAKPAPAVSGQAQAQATPPTGAGPSPAGAGPSPARGDQQPQAGVQGAGQHGGGQHGAAQHGVQPASSVDAGQTQPSRAQPSQAQPSQAQPSLPQPSLPQLGHPQPVQTAQPSAPTAPANQPAQPAPHPAVYQQLADPLLKLRASGDGSHTMTVALHPAELGPVNLHVRLVGDTMTIQLASSSESAHAALHEALGELRQELRGAGLAGVQLSLDLHGESAGQSAGGFGQSGQRSSGGQPVTVPSASSSANGATPVRPRSTTTGLDRWL